jgi:hypothetical protein
MPQRPNSPIKTSVRKAKAQRRVGVGAVCTQCGESNAQALVARSRPRLCYECYQERRGKKRTEPHHYSGKANSSVTVEVAGNVHRAVLSDAQYEWPPTTLQNTDGSPLLKVAAGLRGAADFVERLIVQFFRQCAQLLEKLDPWLREKYGEWWIGSPFEGWQPG